MTDAPFSPLERLHYVSGHGDHMARFFISKKRCARKQQLIRRTFSNGAGGEKKNGILLSECHVSGISGDFL